MVPNQIADGLLAVNALDLRRPVQHPGIDLGLVEELSRLVGVIRAAPESELPRILAELIRLLLTLTTRDATRDDADPRRQLVDRACHRLSEDHRTALVQTYLRERPYNEVAAELGIPLGTLRSRVFYGLKALRVSMDDMGVTP